MRLSGEIRMHWKPVKELKSSSEKLKKILPFLIGMLTLVTLMLLSSCVKTKYVEVQRETITCYKTIKTPLDMAKCLEEYKTKY